MARRCEKWGFLLWIFAEERGIGGVYWSVIGHRLRVGAMGVKGKAQEWCRFVWTGVEMWERGDVKHQSWVPHLRDGFIVDKVGHRAKARSISLRQSRDIRTGPDSSRR